MNTTCSLKSKQPLTFLSKTYVSVLIYGNLSLMSAEDLECTVARLSIDTEGIGTNPEVYTGLSPQGLTH